MDSIIYLLFFISFAITLVAQILVSARYSKYSKILNSKGLTGFDVAKKILEKNGLGDIYVVETKGYLSDHYDPGHNVIRLSHGVFHGESLSAAAIAAHEVGHAIQKKQGNFFMKIRSFIFPIVNFSSKFGYIAILIGLIFGYMRLFYLGIFMLFVILFFQLVTLPVEFDASRKAMANLEKYNILLADEKRGARKVLVAAALTYVASLVTTLLEILRLLLVVMDNKD
ncbi:MAG: zinc metallopeptidase [bacterium]|nr:zinc metallopeptidase [bacterium]